MEDNDQNKKNVKKKDITKLLKQEGRRVNRFLENLKDADFMLKLERRFYDRDEDDSKGR